MYTLDFKATMCRIRVDSEIARNSEMFGLGEGEHHDLRKVRLMVGERAANKQFGQRWVGR